RENNGCFKCRKTHAGHIAANCPERMMVVSARTISMAVPEASCPDKIQLNEESEARNGNKLENIPYPCPDTTPSVNHSPRFNDHHNQRPCSAQCYNQTADASNTCIPRRLDNEKNRIITTLAQPDCSNKLLRVNGSLYNKSIGILIDGGAQGNFVSEQCV